MSTAISISIYVIGITQNKALPIPLQISISNNDQGLRDRGMGEIGGALATELPYVKSVMGRLLPEISIFLENKRIELVSEIDKNYHFEVMDTSSAQLPLALSICMVLRKSFGLSYLENFSATGALDPLGFVTHVEQIPLKKLAAGNILFFDPFSLHHIFIALRTMSCLVTR
jgi:hypothetical protein